MKSYLLFKRLLLVWVFAISGSVWGQTNPDTGTLPYQFNGAATIPTTIAVHRFGTSSGTIPTTRTTSNGNGDLPISTASNSGGYLLEGTNGADGISMIASGSNAAGAILVEVSTLGKENITVGWVAWTVLDQASYTNSIALQYRVGDSGLWLNVDSPTSSVYSTGTVGRSNGVSFNQTLPAGANNKSIVQLRWIYWVSSGTAGSRDRLGIDNINIDGTAIVTSDPALTITGVQNNGSTCINNSATKVTYTITNSGTLPAAGINIGSSNSHFVVSNLSSTSIAAGGGTSTFDVVFTPTTAVVENATITVTSSTSGSNTATYAINGTGINTAPTVTSPTSAAITTTSATLGGNITVQGCSPITERGIYYSTTSGFADGTGTKLSETGTFTAGVFTINTIGLTSNTTYYYKAFALSTSGTAYSAQGSFKTLPNYCGGDHFYDTGGSAGSYSSNENVTTVITPSAGNIATVTFNSFDTELNYDYLKVYDGPNASSPALHTGSGFSGTTNPGSFTSTHPSGSLTFVFTSDVSGTRVGWDATVNCNPTPTCIVPTALTSTALTAITVTLNWTASSSNPVNGYDYYYSTTNTAPVGATTPSGNVGAGITTANITALLSNTAYYYWIRSNCGGGDESLWADGGSFTTSNIASPLAIVASDITTTGFSANWVEVAGATGYELEVSKSPTFGSTATSTIAEGFETGLSTSGYQTGNATLNSGVWAVTNVIRGTTGNKSGSYSAQLQNATNSALVSPSFTDGVSSFTFWVSSGTGGAVQVNYSTDGGVTWLAAPNSPFTGLGSTIVQKSVTINTTVPTMIQFKRTAALVYIDDIEISYATSTPDFVAGYNPKMVTGGTTATTDVTGLTSSTQYYYRVRAKDANSTSVNSTVINVTTLLPSPTITLSNNGTQVAAGDIMQGANNQILSTFKVDVTNANATMTDAAFTTDGDYTDADISDFKLWYNSTNSFSGASLLATESSSSSGSGEFLDFSGFSTTINSGSAGYFWITTSTTIGATIGKTINVDGISDADLTFTNGNSSGSADVAGLQTIVATTTVTWVGTSPSGSWTNGTPNSSVDVIIDGDYNETASFSAKTLTVNLNKTLIVNSYQYVDVVDVINNGDILVAHNANFKQTGTFTSGPGSEFKVSRATKDVQRFDYVSWSSPLKNSVQTLKEFSYGIVNPSAEGTLNTRFYTYNGGSFVNTTSLHSEPFVTGQGYQIRTPNDFTTVAPGTTFHGFFVGVKPNTGPITYNASSISGDYVFLGNPYPSAISMADFLTANNAGLTGISGTIYIWNSAAKMVGTAYTGPDNYISHNASGSTPPGSAFYVPVAQGFFVDRQGNTVNNFVFNDAMRSATETGTFAKAAVVDRFWLKMDSNAGSPHMLFAFSADATAGQDHEYDGKMMDNNPDTFYTKVNGEKMVIDTHGSFQASDSFDVYINSTAVKNYTISIAQKDGLFNNGGQAIYLRDKANGTVTDLSTADYTFTSNGTGEENRLEVYFTNSVLATANAVKEDINIYANQGVLVVEAPKDIANVKVYDLSGRLLLNKKGQGKTMKATINAATIVVVHVELQDGSSVSKKVKL